MKLEIFDVGHGGCAVVTGTNGKKMMLDCGFRKDPHFFPSVAFHGQTIELLALMNLDEDHCDDLPYLWKETKINAIYSNPTVHAQALWGLKNGQMREGVKMAQGLLQEFGAGLVGSIANLGYVSATAYHNVYGSPFVDTNNLSLAVFVQYGSFSILFAGDLETAGWRKLLQIQSFRTRLAAINILVASHHGRKSGQCPEVFNLVRPDVVIFSDDARQYETQNTDAWYRQRVVGIPNLGAQPMSLSGCRKRHVLTTRRDGNMVINVESDGRYLITPSKGSSNSLAQFNRPTSLLQMLSA